MFCFINFPDFLISFIDVCVSSIFFSSSLNLHSNKVTNSFSWLAAFWFSFNFLRPLINLLLCLFAPWWYSRTLLFLACKYRSYFLLDFWAFFRIHQVLRYNWHKWSLDSSLCETSAVDTLADLYIWNGQIFYIWNIWFSYHHHRQHSSLWDIVVECQF